MPKLSVIIVAYKSAATLGKCITSLPGNAEIIVVDNSPPTDALPNVIYIPMERNEGFGRACNVGLSRAGGDSVLILNPDAWADSPEDVGRLVAALDNGNVVAVGGRLMLRNGTVQLSCAKRLTLWSVFLEQSLLEKVVRGYWIDTSHDKSPRKVPQVTGACFAMKRINGEFLRFDERFFLYCEDTELMARLSKHGDILHEPNAVFHHQLGASSEANRWWAVACYNRGKELYFQIHYGEAQVAFCFLLNRLGALLRLAIYTVATLITLGTVKRFRTGLSTFFKVLVAPIDPYKSAPWTPRKP